MSKAETIITFQQRAQLAFIAFAHPNRIYINDQFPFYYEVVFLIAPNLIGLVDGSRYGLYVQFTTDIVNGMHQKPTMYTFASELDYKLFRDKLSAGVAKSELFLDKMYTLDSDIDG